MIPLIFVSGPLMTGGNTARNIERAVETGIEIAEMGAVPFIPHLYYHANKISPHSEQWWLSLGFKMITICDALYVFDINSNGGRKEMIKAQECGKPVFFEMKELKRWIDKKMK
jgi:hypothetical protein